MPAEALLLFPVTLPHLLLQLSCGSHSNTTDPPPPPFKLLFWAQYFAAGLSLGSLPRGHSPVPKYHMFLHVEHINNFLPVIHWHRTVYLSWMIYRLQAHEKWMKCTGWTRPPCEEKNPHFLFSYWGKSCFSLSYFGCRPLDEMYIPLPAVIRHDSLSKWQIIAGGPKEGRISPRDAWSKAVLPFFSDVLYLESCYLLVDLLFWTWCSFKGLYGRLFYGNVRNDERGESLH